MPKKVVTYEVRLAPRALRDFKQLDKPARKKIFAALEKLQADPRPRGANKLEGIPDLWRIWVGRDHRLVYAIDDDLTLVIVAIIRKRADVYRGVQKLSKSQLLREIGLRAGRHGHDD